MLADCYFNFSQVFTKRRKKLFIFSFSIFDQSAILVKSRNLTSQFLVLANQEADISRNLIDHWVSVKIRYVQKSKCFVNVLVKLMNKIFSMLKYLLLSFFII